MGVLLDLLEDYVPQLGVVITTIAAFIYLGITMPKVIPKPAKDHPEYHFNGKIGSDQVRHYQGCVFNRLEIINSEGDTTVFVDKDGEENRFGKLIPEYKIKNGNRVPCDPIDESVFRGYLNGIKKVKSTSPKNL